MKRPGIPKAAPTSEGDAFGRVLDLAEAVAAIRIAAESETHPLTLPAGAVAKITEAHQALLAAHRIIEEAIQS